LAQNRDDATAAICATEFGNIVSSVTTTYAKQGYTDFQTVTVADVFNGKTGATGVTSGDTGTNEAGTALVKDGVTYKCEGASAASLSFNLSGQDYNMTITETGNVATVPAAIKAGELVRKNYKIGTAGGNKVIQL
jgi:hypothetical protein